MLKREGFAHGKPLSFMASRIHLNRWYTQTQPSDLVSS